MKKTKEIRLYFNDHARFTDRRVNHPYFIIAPDGKELLANDTRNLWFQFKDYIFETNEKYNKNRLKEIHSIMANIYYPNRYRWCNSGECYCMGCMNVSERCQSTYDISKKEWEEWAKLNPENHNLCSECYKAEVIRVPEKDNKEDKAYTCPNCKCSFWRLKI